MKLVFISILCIILNYETFSTGNLVKSDSVFVYLVKQRWHTGIVFKTAEIDTEAWREIKPFMNFKYIDIGWGDEEFYQYQGDFDLELAIKALFYPTQSVLRVEGFSFEISKYVQLSDYAVRIHVTPEQLRSLCKLVSGTFFKNEHGDVDVLNEKYGGNIKFYKANNNYHAFNTCNTWIAKGLQEAGFDINPSIVILAQDLFIQVERFGTVLKSNGDLE